MLLLNRRDAVKANLGPKSEKIGWQIWKRGMLKRGFMDMFGGKMKNFLLKNFFGKYWGNKRELPKIADKSFSTQWKKEHPSK